jgi:hypothetical protein
MGVLIIVAAHVIIRLVLLACNLFLKISFQKKKSGMASAI